MTSHRLFAVELTIAAGQQGRAFTLDATLAGQTNVLTQQMEACFADDEDRARQKLLERAIGAAPVLDVDVYPGEAVSQEFQAYVIARDISEHPLFACVLATTEVVRELLLSTPLVLETATFQVIGDVASPFTIGGGIEAWIHRLWPDAGMPAVRIRQWPAVTEDDAMVFFSGVSSDKPMLGAPSELPQDRWLQ